MTLKAGSFRYPLTLHFGVHNKHTVSRSGSAGAQELPLVRKCAWVQVHGIPFSIAIYALHVSNMKQQPITRSLTVTMLHNHRQPRVPSVHHGPQVCRIPHSCTGPKHGYYLAFAPHTCSVHLVIPCTLLGGHCGATRLPMGHCPTRRSCFRNVGAFSPALCPDLQCPLTHAPHNKASTRAM
jgi:hypothetical protein